MMPRTTAALLAAAQSSRGAAMVEMVFALPIFLLLVVGIVEIGRLIMTYQALSDGSRAAARYLARIESWQDPNTGICSQSQLRTAASIVSTRTLDWSEPALFAGWPASESELAGGRFSVVVAECTAGAFNAAPGTVTVTASAPYEQATGLGGLIAIPGEFVMNGEHQQVQIPD